MIDHGAALLALRNRALSLVVCTTGVTTLAATATGFSRTAGSFVTDGFLPGMEVTPVGYADTTPAVIEAVTALNLTTTTPRTVEAAAGNRSLSVGLPAIAAWENIETTPITGRPFLEEGYVPATMRAITYPLSNGTAEETGLYVLRWYGLSDFGSAAIRKCLGALTALFTPGTVLTAGSNSLRVRGDIGPIPSPLIPQKGGWTIATISIPWRAYSQNVIAP